MKIKTLILLIVAFFAISVIYASGPACMYIHGTYVNTDYDDKGTIAKFSLRSECIYSIYEKTTSTVPIITDCCLGDERGYSGSYHLVRGDLIKILIKNENGDTYYGLVKFSYGADGSLESTFMEAVWSKTEYPDKINPSDSNYIILYSQ
jgi:hypothetical protein